MTEKELFSFITKFNQAKSIGSNIIVNGLKTLPEKDHELFMLLVNYKNGDSFLNFIKAGKK